MRAFTRNLSIPRLQDLELAYQPIFDLHKLRISAAEALIRWNHPSFGQLLPDSFLPALLRSAQMRSVTRWVIQSAVKKVASWHAMGFRDLRVCVNLSISELLDDRLLEYAENAVMLAELKRNDVEFEICERGRLLEIPTAMRAVRRFQKSGFRIAIDDFGVGSSSLRYLLDVPATTIKFDRSFIAGVPCPRHGAVLRQVAYLAAELGYDVVIEGIENKEDLAFVMARIGGFGQGRYLGPPVPSQLLEAWLETLGARSIPA